MARRAEETRPGAPSRPLAHPAGNTLRRQRLNPAGLRRTPSAGSPPLPPRSGRDFPAAPGTGDGSGRGSGAGAGAAGTLEPGMSGAGGEHGCVPAAGPGAGPPPRQPAFGLPRSPFRLCVRCRRVSRQRGLQAQMEWVDVSILACPCSYPLFTQQGRRLGSTESFWGVGRWRWVLGLARGNIF